MNEKKCSKCLETKSLDLFYAEKRGFLGRRGECKACQLKRHKAYRVSTGREVVKNQKARYVNSEHGKQVTKEYNRRYMDSGRAREYFRRYRAAEENRAKRSARSALRYQVKKGQIQRQACEVCGAAVAQAHHDDYSKPLDVRWLCAKHHSEHHRTEANA